MYIFSCKSDNSEFPRVYANTTYNMVSSQNASFSIAVAIWLTLICMQQFSITNARLIDRETDSWPVPELVTRCRASCLDKFLYTTAYDVKPFEKCRDDTNCLMCWDFCQYLYLENRATMKNMCTDYTCVSIFREYTAPDEDEMCGWEHIIHAEQWTHRLIFILSFSLQFKGCRHACGFYNYMSWIKLYP